MLIALILILVLHSVFVIRGYYKTDGISLSYSFSLALLIQVIIPIFIVCYIRDLRLVSLEPEIIQRILTSYIIYMAVAFVAFVIIGYYRRRILSDKKMVPA